MNSLRNQWIIVQAYKHNGELHRQWSHSLVVEDNTDYFVTVSIRASVTESDGRKWHTKEPAVFIMSKKEWFNVIAMIKEDGVCFYVNIASPTIYDKGFLKYIDYDLDVKLYVDGSTRLLDVSEYHRHAKEQHYPDDIRHILTQTVDKMYELMNEKKYPFDANAVDRYLKEFKKIVN